MFLYGLGNRNAFNEMRKLCIWDVGLRAGIRESCGKQLVYYGNADLPEDLRGVKGCKAKRPVEVSKAMMVVSEKGVLEAAGTYVGKKYASFMRHRPKHRLSLPELRCFVILLGKSNCAAALPYILPLQQGRSKGSFMIPARHRG